MRAAPRGGSRNIEDDDFVGALRFVARRLFGGIAGVAQILKPDALHHSAVLHVEARNQAP